MVALVCCVGLVFWTEPAVAADPAHYVRKATWQEAMLASRVAMNKARARRPSVFTPFVSPVMRGRAPARHVKLRVAGARELWLIATGVPNNHHGYSDWGEARLISKDGRVTRLRDMKPVSFWRSYGQLRLNKGHSGGPLQIGERCFQHGLGVHADSRLCYALDSQYEWFEAWIGIDIAKGRRGLGHVRFEIRDAPPKEEGGLEALWRALRRDFPDVTARRQMARERSDGIWVKDWTPGDLTALAQRYVALLDAEPGLDLGSVCHTANTRRTHFP
ncbi:NPCBM/NEW2 domain-containing protein, partial [bacterium]|nr:NPCBM/NEW2 domain-containing protein [bacterium]